MDNDKTVTMNNTIKKSIRYPNGDKYNGEMDDQMRFHGKGTMKYANGTKYDGSWIKGVFHGDGVFTQPDNEKCTCRLETDVIDIGVCSCGCNHQGRNGTDYVDCTCSCECTGYDSGCGCDLQRDHSRMYEPIRRVSEDWECECEFDDGFKYTGSFEHGFCHGRGIKAFNDGITIQGIWAYGYLSNENKSK